MSLQNKLLKLVREAMRQAAIHGHQSVEALKALEGVENATKSANTPDQRWGVYTGNCERRIKIGRAQREEHRSDRIGVVLDALPLNGTLTLIEEKA